MRNKSLIFIISAVLVIILVFVVSVTVGKGKSGLLSGKHYVDITVKDYGDIIVELDADVAPITVTNFVKLVRSGFYDGLTFHRIINGFMIQGGAPKENNVINAIKGEFKLNGIENKISHVRGTISMARTSNDYNSASSQFFIMHEDDTSLDGKYAGFGKVISGMDVVDEIAKVKVVDRNGKVEEKDQPIIEKIRVIQVGKVDLYDGE